MKAQEPVRVPDGSDLFVDQEPSVDVADDGPTLGQSEPETSPDSGTEANRKGPGWTDGDSLRK